MGRVVKPFVVVEIFFLVVAFAAALTVVVPLWETQDQFPKVKCLPYTSVDYIFNPPHYWGSITVTPPDSNGTCNYCIFSEIAVAVVALFSIVYRIVTVCDQKYDMSFLRTISVPIYLLCTLSALVEGVILQVGVNRFLAMIMTYKTGDEKTKTCYIVQAGLQRAAESSSLNLTLNFCTEFNVATCEIWNNHQLTNQREEPRLNDVVPTLRMQSNGDHKPKYM
ncbi:uncharacterized protein LOC110975504 isoform X1 [Acanthaster planci]|uniref:Uncharacterized protein LOC110975504 isoform X1 n=1 Tax=Acanthaster planci TaxID=133434 RepID=A0A8B7XV16_ACAPL|nr:uncharacterized protein LOC110975504 isoform X1 [Acanthaster planci]